MTDGPFRRYKSKERYVLARQVKEKKVVKIDDFGNDIVIWPGDWEIINLRNGTRYGNLEEDFPDNWELDE